MTSPVPFQIIDDDDEFDWEAAVREIDASCERANNPSSTTTWIYPVHVPLIDYQLATTKTALFTNTVVALPTGLGKTLTPAVVMYNYSRCIDVSSYLVDLMEGYGLGKKSSGKIVFAAPSRPLVMQQIEACHNIVGTPQEWTIDMTGQFSHTEQISGTCLAKHLVCLVMDEAHRASGNYSYCVAIHELLAIPVQLRILALTATPGSKQPAVQHIIDNLQISALEYRSESDPDVIPYVDDRKIELIEVWLRWGKKLLILTNGFGSDASICGKAFYTQTSPE
ncbi:DEAD-box ATP-dependent RNA helicase FANCM-like isoform X1 [Populus alba x Populus x berolinensis]|nr:DEAD-box ATP-dependent RNA helicase FANCM-like isoform X1 [Populus alba x Populus x berolinensis]